MGSPTPRLESHYVGKSIGIGQSLVDLGDRKNSVRIACPHVVTKAKVLLCEPLGKESRSLNDEAIRPCKGTRRAHDALSILFLCRCFARSFLCLCLRIFLRLFLMMLPIRNLSRSCKDCMFITSIHPCQRKTANSRSSSSSPCRHERTQIVLFPTDLECAPCTSPCQVHTDI